MQELPRLPQAADGPPDAARSPEHSDAPDRAPESGTGHARQPGETGAGDAAAQSETAGARVDVSGGTIHGPVVADNQGSITTHYHQHGPQQVVTTDGGDYAEGSIDRRSGVFIGTVYLGPRMLVLRVLAVLLVMVLGGIGWLIKAQVIDPARPRPMPEGWNLTIAGIGVAPDGSAVDGQAGLDLSDRLHSVLEASVGPDHIRGWRDAGVGTVTGNAEQRRRQAEEIARLVNADVVVYGLITPTTPGRAHFAPEFFIAGADPVAGPIQVYGAELLGPEQFGSAIPFSLSADEPNPEIRARIEVLKSFLAGLRYYLEQDFDQARVELAGTLELLDGHDGDPQAGSVVHLFRGALEIALGDRAQLEHQAAAARDYYRQAQAQVLQAHEKWPGYARPYLSQGTVYSQLALMQINGLAAAAPERTDVQAGCFDQAGLPELTAQEYLMLARSCYDEGLRASGQAASMDLEPKIRFSRGSIDLAASIYGGQDYWQRAGNSFSQVIDFHEQADATLKQRLRVVAAHAYAKRGLITICRPDCDAPAVKSADEYRAAAGDYRHALALLRSPEGCANDTKRCYPDDVPFIETYQEQLDRLNRHLDTLSTGENDALPSGATYSATVA